MKKTLTVNLGGTVFHIDEDAFHLLDKYLANLKVHFRKEDGAEEIVKDMELRISELFTEKLNGGAQVISIHDVEEIIARMGKPEELTDDDTKEEKITGEPHQDTYKTTEQPRKRFFRNPDDRVLGGVASGLGAYMGWDVTAIRLILFFIAFFGYGTIIPIYIICWMIVPEALTASEKLSMRGERVTVENIGKTVTDGFERVSNGVNDYINSTKPRTTLQHIGDVLVQIVGVCIKVFLVFMAVVLSPLLFGLIIALFALIIAGISILVGGGTALFHLVPFMDWGLVYASPIQVTLACIAAVILIGIPLVALVYGVFAHLLKWTPMSYAVKLTLIILWTVSLITSLILFPAVVLPSMDHEFYSVII